MAYKRGLLTGKDLNEVQENILSIILNQENKKEYDKQEANFEQQLLLHRPEMLEKYQELKEERESQGYDTIVWSAPETPEEAQALFSTFAEISAEAKKLNKEDLSEDFSQQLALLEQLENMNIDISQLGDEDG